MKNQFKPSDYKNSIKHIEKSWGKLVSQNKKDDGTLIGLPNKYVSPSDDWFAGDMFYWDSYFIIIGLVDSGRIELAKGIVENFLYLQDRFGVIPLRNRFYNLGTSQPPFLTSMALEVFGKDNDKKWLLKMAKAAEKEMTQYWENANHLKNNGLSRYCDHYIVNETAEHESGWDMTSRFNGRCLDYIPVDLNSFLYKYEKDLGDIYKILDKKDIALKWGKKAKKRKKLLYKYCWSKRRGFFFDYDTVTGRRSFEYTLAGFAPMWAGLVDNATANKMLKKIKKFEQPGGLATTTKPLPLIKTFQWDYPNGWAPLHWLVIKGLISYGFNPTALRIGKKWLDLNSKLLETSGHLWERYDVVKCIVPKNERYPLQIGFGWTDGVFVRLYNELKKISGQI